MNQCLVLVDGPQKKTLFFQCFCPDGHLYFRAWSLPYGDFQGRLSLLWGHLQRHRLEQFCAPKATGSFTKIAKYFARWIPHVLSLEVTGLDRMFRLDPSFKMSMNESILRVDSSDSEIKSSMSESVADQRLLVIQSALARVRNND
jgi:hypothetical protein